MKTIPALLFCLLATVAVTAERAPTLDDILARHAASAGPPLESLEVALTIVEPDFTVTADYLARRDGRMRIDVYAGDSRVFIEALDGSGGWQWNAGDAEPRGLSDTGRAALLRGVIANLYGLHERPALGYTLAFEGGVTIDGRRYWQVSSVAPDGFEEILYLDPNTAAIARKREVSALHPDIDPREAPIETRFSDWRRQDGRLLSFRSEKVDLATGQRLQQATLDTVVVDPSIDDARFEPDAS